MIKNTNTFLGGIVHFPGVQPNAAVLFIPHSQNYYYQ